MEEQSITTDLRVTKSKIVLIILLIPSLSGCAILGSRSLGKSKFEDDYALTPSTVVQSFNVTKPYLYSVALHTAQQNGLVDFSDPETGQIRLKTGDAEIVITVKELALERSRLTVEARDPFNGPRAPLARYIHTQIIQSLSTLR